MKPSQKNILMYGSIGALIGVALCLIAIATVQPSVFAGIKIPSKNETLCIEKTVFDTEAAILNSNVKILYPKEGFYAMGSEVSFASSSNQEPYNRDLLSPPGQGRRVLGSVQIMPTKEPIVYEPVSEMNPFGEIFRGISMTATVYEKKIPGDLESFIDRVKANKDINVRSEIEAGYWHPTNGNLYYIYRSGDDVSNWIALSFKDDIILEVRFNDMIRGDGDQMALLRSYQPRIIQQALSHISFE